MVEWLSKTLGWLKSVYSEADGTGSSSRVHVGILVVFVVVAGGVFVHLVHAKAITVEQFDSFLVAAGTFLATACGVLYGSNKLADVFKKKDDGQ